MIKIYLKNLKRNIAKKRLNNFINLLGLSNAFTFSLLIASFVWNETHVNADLKDIERQYLLHSEATGITTAGLLAPALAQDYPNLVEDYFRFDGIQSIASYNNNKHDLSAIIADDSFFNMFGFVLQEGNPETALSQPDQVVLTYETALKLFGRTSNILGEQLEINNFNEEKKLFHVSGVLNKLGENSVIDLIADSPTEIIFPLKSGDFLGRNLDSWENPYIASYIKLKEGVTTAHLKVPILKLLDTHMQADQQKFLGQTQLSKLSTYHLEKANNSIKNMLITLSLIAGFILLMASVNFINISTNSATKRLREISVRKVLGANKWHLRLPILLESLLFVGLSLLISIACYPLLSKWSSALFGKQLPPLYAFDLNFWFYTVAIALLIAAAAGIYPAFRLSSLPTGDALKGKITQSIENTLIKKGLVSFQFAVTLTILICSVYIFYQIKLIHSSNKLGYDKDLLITVPTPRNWSHEGLQQMSDVRDRLAQHSSVASISLSYDIPTAMGSGIDAIKRNAAAREEISAQYIFADEHFAHTYKIPMLAGAFTGKEKGYNGVVINTILAKNMGYSNPSDAVGNTIFIPAYNTDIAISGVTADFYSNSLHSPIHATVWLPMVARPLFRFFTIRLTPGNIKQKISDLENEWQKLMPEALFQYTFMDERLAVRYHTESRIQQAGVVATILTLIITLLGIFSLLAQRIELSIKAIGVRKVLGATANQINGLFVREIGYLYLTALPIALLTSYWIINKWLTNFQEKTSYDIVKTAVPIVLLASIVIILISLQTYKAARANPVDSLRDE